jgi:Zn-dependent peptidase ImmA (M78 family)
MAMELGEKLALEAGYTAFPIDPRAIAKSKDIKIEAKPPETKGISGALILAGDAATIIYSTEHENEGFENFSIAHEIGHYCIPGHPEEILKSGGVHISKADFTQGGSLIELEADHFASGLLMPSSLTKDFLSKHQVGLAGVLELANVARCSRTAAAIRAAECSSYPIAIIVSREDEISYAFMSDSFKRLGEKLAFLRKGTPLPDTATRAFNADPKNVLLTKQQHDTTTLYDWFDGSRKIGLDEEIVGLGRYGYTLTILTSEELPNDPDDDPEETDEEFKERWTPRFAYGR